MRSASLFTLSWLLLSGCASVPDGGPEAAREVVLKNVGEGVGTVGPFNRKDKKELESLSPQDRSAAVALLDRGALGVLVFGPNKEAKRAATTSGALADLVVVDRILFVQRGQIVGDFAAVK